MNAVKATWRNGMVVLEGQPDWPEGRTLLVLELSAPGNQGPGDEDSMTSNEITRTLAAMEEVQPLAMTPDEETVWEAQRHARKQWEKSHFEEHAEKLRSRNCQRLHQPA